MTLLYRVEDEIAIEMSADTFRVVETLVRDAVLGELFPASSKGYDTTVFNQLDNFANAIRSHLQHLAPTPVPVTNNSDLA